MPELPRAKFQRFYQQYQLPEAVAGLLTEDQAVADYFERAVAAVSSVPAKTVANWVTGELFALMNQAGIGVEALKIEPQRLAELVQIVVEGQINQNTAKDVLAEMFASGQSAIEIVEARGLRQVSDADFIARIVKETLDENNEEVASYKAGKVTVANWLFGQVMRKAQGKANPQVVRSELEKQLTNL